MLGSIGAICILAVAAGFDIRTRKIPGFVFSLGGIWAALAILIRLKGTGAAEVCLSVLPALLPGTAMLALSFLTEDKVGRGDGLLLMILGMLEKVRIIFPMFCLGLFFQSLAAVFLLILKKADRQSCIPFVPFLLAARLLVLLL